MTVALVVVGDAASWRAMTRYPVQQGERAWTRALRTGDDQGGAAAERVIARALPARARVAADDATAVAVAALSPHPGALLTPAGLGGTERWRRALARAPYVLARRGDLADRSIPGLARALGPGYATVASAGPYVLARLVSRP